MRRALVVMFLLLVGGLFPSHARAQRTQNACVQQVYDAAEFHTLSFKNVCGAPIYVVWMSRTPGLKGKADIEPGMKAGTGKFANDVQLFGGIVIFACFKGYIPVDAANNPVSKPILEFWCKRY